MPCRGRSGACRPRAMGRAVGHITLAFSSLSSIAAIALSPESAPNSLFTNLLQCNAYAISLLYYLLSDSSGLDWFHAAYALMLALSCLIPLTAIAASPPWAVTGEESPAIRAQKEEATIMGVLSAIERGESLRRKKRRRKKRDSDSSSSSGDSEHEGLLKRKRDRKLTRKFVLMKEREERPCCGVSASHVVLYVGFTFSVLLWAACFWLGIVGGLTGATKVSLSQPNCTATLGGATLLLYTMQDLGLMLLAVVVFVASVINPLVSDVANAMDRESLISCNTNPQLVFGLSFIVW
ncbi:hypothetical protein BCR35DRAFT_315944, partial [Leucosporidium creatinivorum]